MTSENNSLAEDEESPSPFWLVLAALIVFLVLILFWFSVTKLISIPAEQGQFGDMFGAANTLFSGLAFAGIIYTIWLQRTELKLQRKTLIETQEELRLSREAHELTTDIMTSQLAISKNTAKLENARFRKEVLPRFINNRLNESDGSLGDNHLKCSIFIDNIGKRIISANVFHLTGDLDPPELKAEYLVIEPQTTFVIPFSCRIHPEDGGSWEKFEIHFSTEDDSKWKCEFSTFVNEARPLPIKFEPAVELYSPLNNAQFEHYAES